MNLFLNPYLQAFIFTIILAIPVYYSIPEYKVEIAEKLRMMDNRRFYYTDLDHDGWSERIATSANSPGLSEIVIQNHKGIIDQWRVRGEFFYDSPRFMSGDFDHNGLDEIYLFTFIGDSVFLNCVDEFESPARFRFRDRLVGTIHNINGKQDQRIIEGKMKDLDGDGYLELVFGLMTGYTIAPRNVFSYDIRRDKITQSPKSGFYFSNMVFYDLNNDGRDEIILNGYSPYNIHDTTYPYIDQSSWLMVLGPDLDFFFPPVEFPGEYSTIVSTPVKDKAGRNVILGYFRNDGQKENPNRIFLADIDGRIINEKPVGNGDPFYRFSALWNSYLISSNGLYGNVESKGEFLVGPGMGIRQISCNEAENGNTSLMDIDRDGKKEIISFNSREDTYLVLRNDFSSAVSLGIPLQKSQPDISLKLNGSDKALLAFSGDDASLLFAYEKSSLYRQQLFIYLLGYLIILSFILVIRKLYSIQLKKRYRTEQEIARLQISSIKAQMEPHFLFNVINTIGSSIYKQNRDEAYKLVVKFSGMVRSLVNSSDKLSRSLQEEIDFTRNYLDLEQTRFEKKFSYSIKIDESLDPELQIPKMIIQIHTENALKHGLSHLEKEGKLNINIFPEDNNVIIEIIDNGVGRLAAAKNNSSTGKGLLILSRIYELFEKEYGRRIFQDITDLYDENNVAAGTRVLIKIQAS